MRFTAQSLFELPTGIDTAVQDIKRGAWRGDCILKQYINKYLWDKYSDRDIAFLNARQDLLISNKSLALFLDEATDILMENVPEQWGSSAELVNDHSKGTIFEWLLYRTSLLDDEAATDRAVKRYIGWIEASSISSVEVLLPTSSNDVDLTVVEGVLKCIMQPIGTVLLKQLFNNPTLAYSSKAFLKPGDIHVAHSMKTKAFKWCSRKRNIYTDKFYLCCGMREEDSHCLRTNWSNPRSHHPGELRQILYGGKKAGGGCTDDHIPRMIVPQWSCCGLTAPAEGCLPEGFNPNANVDEEKIL